MPTLRQNNKELYWMWKAIKQRCNNPRCPAYCNYGARGITYTKEWEQFESFYEWAMNTGWKKGLELDRINNDGNYEPSNCRFITRRENMNNRRITIYLTINNDTKPLSVWAEIAKINRGTIKLWVKNHGKEYAEFRIKDALENGYKFGNYSYGHKKKVRHLESGMVFESGKEAKEYFKMSSSTVWYSLKHHTKTHKGTFVYEEETKKDLR